MLDRRSLLKAGLLAGGALLLPGAGRSSGAARRPGAAGLPFSCSLPRTSSLRQPPFEAELPIPPVLAPVRSTATTDWYRVTMAATEQPAVAGVPAPLWTYAGTWPGPTIVARRGRRVVVTQQNDLPFDTVVHLHGGRTPPEHDGGPTDVIPPGTARTYVYENDQRACTLHYHDHALMATGPHVYRGLSGFYLITDAVEDGLDLPRGAFDVPLLVQDRIVDADGSFWYPATTSDGLEGDTIFVNGAVQPRMAVRTRQYRLRILNGSNCRTYELALSGGRQLRVIGTDGGLVPRPVKRPSVRLAPGERVEVVVDFRRAAVGDQVVLRNLAGSGPTADVMRFDVTWRERDPVEVPAELRPLAPLTGATVTRDLELSHDTDLGWVIDGQGFDPDRVDARPAYGSTEIWQFRNVTGMAHPMHLHLVHFQVLDRDGAPPPPEEVGWKDTVLVAPGETVRVIARFSGHRGRYVFHCHNLEHEDHDMMGQFEVV
ncbi:MAG TPA: multicopper oxidase family protein [Acidimicrobiales bacterium]